MHRIEIKRQFDDDEAAAIQGLLTAATEADAHAPLDEHAWLDLVQGGREGFAGLVAWLEGHDHPVGYAQVSRGPRPAAHASDHGASWALEYVVDPHHRVPGNTIGRDLVVEAARVIAAEGGGHVHMWVNQPRPEHERIAAAVGLRPGRALYQMRRPLPVEPALDDASDALPTRAFRPGVDEPAWLEVNNQAFRWHPEQGGWELATIKERESQPWFDPEGFLLHFTEGTAGTETLAGFCWTKVHREHVPTMGEIYVIAVHPDFSGRGFGRALTLAGLRHLAGKGIGVGMLYVDAANRAAVKLYIDLGFVINHVDQAYVGDVAPAQ
ncbi:MAG: mycothiol synthase [Acidimicrobiales bacterium]